MLKPVEQLAGGEQPAADGGQLERERQTVKAGTNRPQHRLVAGEVGSDRAGALREQRDRLVEWQRLERVLVIARQMQLGAACDEQLQLRTVDQQFREQRCRFEQMLEVVEHE